MADNCILYDYLSRHCCVMTKSVHAFYNPNPIPKTSPLTSLMVKYQRASKTGDYQMKGT